MAAERRGTIVSFAAAGIYISFQMLVLGALIARFKGWKPAGPFTLGSWGFSINVLALLYGVSAIINMVWPRSPNDPWYSNYGMIVTAAGIIVLGLIYMVAGGPTITATRRRATHTCWTSDRGPIALSGDGRRHRARRLHARHPRGHPDADDRNRGRGTAVADGSRASCPRGGPTR